MKQRKGMMSRRHAYNVLMRHTHRLWLRPGAHVLDCLVRLSDDGHGLGKHALQLRPAKIRLEGSSDGLLVLQTA